MGNSPKCLVNLYNMYVLHGCTGHNQPGARVCGCRVRVCRVWVWGPVARVAATIAPTGCPWCLPPPLPCFCWGQGPRPLVARPAHVPLAPVPLPMCHWACVLPAANAITWIHCIDPS